MSPHHNAANDNETRALVVLATASRDPREKREKREHAIHIGDAMSMPFELIGDWHEFDECATGIWLRRYHTITVVGDDRTRLVEAVLARASDIGIPVVYAGSPTSELGRFLRWHERIPFTLHQPA